MSEDLVTFVGTIVKDDPILTFTNAGLALCKFSIRVAGTKAKGDKPATPATFHNVTAWRELGENVAESLFKGDRVIVRGIVKHNEWENDAGETKVQVVLNAWNVGPDLSYSTCEVFKAERTEGTQEAQPAPAAAQPAATEELVAL
jgi:single-strand DNA-binding protein